MYNDNCIYTINVHEHCNHRQQERQFYLIYCYCYVPPARFQVVQLMMYLNLINKI
jgi:hypothetical protein